MGSCTSCVERTSTSTGRSRPINDAVHEPEAVKEPARPVHPSLQLDDYDIDSCPLYISKFDFDSRTDDDLGFKRGDLMHVLKADDDGWWLAHSKDRGESGYIPSSYVVEYSCLDKELWYYGNLKCAKAETLLMKECNGRGSFLIRESEVNPGDFVLSLRGDQGVVHYPIKYEWLDSGSYSITSQASFASLSELVVYFQQSSGNLCAVLSSPCVHAEKPPTPGLSKQANTGFEWNINQREIRLQKKIGAGSFAETWEGLWNEKMPVAVKTIKPGLVDRPEFLAEADVIRMFEHPNLLQLYAVCSEGEPMYMITELMKHGSLLEFVRHNPYGKGRSLKHVDLIDMAAQVACGMAYLEEKDYIHRDLAAKNILVGEYLICKVADFGFSSLISEDNYMHWFPIKWTAPEAALHNRYSMKSDVWSFGIVLYEIITYGRTPYAGFVTRDILEAVSEGSYRMPCPPNCPPKLYDIMLDCWSQEPDNRPSFNTLQLQLEEFFTSDESSS